MNLSKSELPESSIRSSTGLQILALGYVAFVVYGSLVPLNFRPIGSFHDALLTFSNIRLFDLGPTKRQDWFANGVLFLPCGLLLSAALSGGLGIRQRFLGALQGFTYCSVLAVGLEFTQQYFPPRTVSLNDLQAEFFGAGVGAVLWMWVGVSIHSNLARLWSRRGILAVHLLSVYGVFYVAISLFPFDIVFTVAELAEKFLIDPPRFFAEISACKNPALCVIKLPLEFLLAFPIGALFLLSEKERGAFVRLKWFVTAALLFSVLIEAAQFFTISGNANGISAIARTAGILAGYWMGRYLNEADRISLIVARGRPITSVLLPLYAALLCWTNGWRFQPPASIQIVAGKIMETSVVPFYYHYRTSETAALISLLSNIAMYLPVGVFVCLWHGGRLRPHQGITTYIAASMLATGVALGRLALSPAKFADFTNILIAGPSALAGLFLARLGIEWLSGKLNGGNDTEFRAPLRSEPETPPRLVLAAASATVTAVIAMLHPFSSAVIPTLVVYVLLLAAIPGIWLLLIPAAVAVVDLGNRTGRLWLDELDLVVGATLTGLLLTRSAIPRLNLPIPHKFVVVLLLGSFLLSAYRAAVPVMLPEAIALSDYLSSWNWARNLRGFIFPLLLLPFLAAYVRHDDKYADALALGFLLAVFSVSLVVIRERYVFPGLFDFDSHFRIAGPFASMHIGGQHIDAFIALTLPLTLWSFFRPAAPALRAFSILVLTTGLYVVVVSFTRATYIAVIAEFIFIAAGLAWMNRPRPHVQVSIPRATGILAILLAATSLTWLGASDTYIGKRFSTTGSDAQTRMSHWNEATSRVSESWTTALIGAGLGTFPKEQWLRVEAEQKPARYLIDKRGETTELRIHGGVPVYLNQKVTLESPGEYTVSMRVKSKFSASSVSVSLCEKTGMYSYGCENRMLTVASKDGWQTIGTRLGTERIHTGLGDTPWHKRRPLFFAIHPAFDASFSVQSISLQNEAGAELLANGSFTEGLDYWSFTSDDHIFWHVKNLWIHLLIEQGWIGVVAFSLFLAMILLKLTREILTGSRTALLQLAAVGGFSIVAITGSLLDAPRIAMLFFLVGFWALCAPPKNPSKQGLASPPAPLENTQL